MPETDETAQDPGNEPEGEGEGMVPRSHIRDLEEKADKVPDLQEQLEDQQRENAFLKAGIDPEDPKAKYFVAGYDGELETEAIQAEAETIGLVGDGQPETTDEDAASEPTEDERRAHEVAAEAAHDAPGDEPADEHPHVRAEQAAKDVLQNGGSRESSIAAGVHEIFDAATDGDSRVYVNPNQPVQ